MTYNVWWDVKPCSIKPVGGPGGVL